MNWELREASTVVTIANQHNFVRPGVRSALRHAADARPWRLPHARLYGRQLLDVAGVRAREGGRRTDAEALRLAVRWLARAQDATGDGGVAGRYRLDAGWSASYPETTGYLVPTLLRSADALDEPEHRRRAGRCVRFLLSVQRPDGSFSGGEVGQGSDEPSAFNTAQILSGLSAWARADGDPDAREAARRAADWLVRAQEDDGTWRAHAFGGRPSAYEVYASCRLAEYGAGEGTDAHLVAAARHLDWVLGLHDPERPWIDRMGFPDHHDAGLAVTHTVGYTLAGLLRSASALGRPDARRAAREVAAGLAGRVEAGRGVPGMVDRRGRGRAGWNCLTGNCQLALVWLALDDGAEPTWARAARVAVDRVKRAQPHGTGSAGLDGGVAGSDPVWGGYLPNAFPNWAAKYFVDALLRLGAG